MTKPRAAPLLCLAIPVVALVAAAVSVVLRSGTRSATPTPAFTLSLDPGTAMSGKRPISCSATSSARRRPCIPSEARS